MRSLVSFALSLALIVLASAPAAAVIVDTARDRELDDLDSTVALRSRIEPFLADIELATGTIADGERGLVPWEAIRQAARDGLASTLDSAVRECSKDYWAMTYSSFGLYYLATTRILDAGDAERAYQDLATAMAATNLSETAYRRAIRDCGITRTGEIDAGTSSAPRPAA